MRTLVSKEVREMYEIYNDVGFELTDFTGMTGDFETDIDSFAKQYKNIKKAIKNIKTDYEEID